jgi:hypothetical protein
MEQRTGPILYKIGYKNNEIIVTAENHNEHVHPIGMKYEDLRRADFSGRSDRRLNLDNADLKNTDMRDIQAYNGSFEGADLTNANLETTDYYTNIGNTNFKNADLSGANLKRCYIIGSDFTGAKLTGADLTGAAYNTGTSNPNIGLIDNPTITQEQINSMIDKKYNISNI